MIGIYGGTFDPVHFGHLRTALDVKEAFALDEIRLIPCSQPAHRQTPMSSPDMRLAMLQLAVQGHEGFSVDRRELDREGYSYMVDTLQSIRHEVATEPLILFLGMDAFSNLERWYQWQRLFDFAHIVVMTRPGYQESLLSDFLQAKLITQAPLLRQKPAGYLYFQAVTPLAISASSIRIKMATGLNPAFLLPDKVIHFIKQNKLYAHSTDGFSK